MLASASRSRATVSPAERIWLSPEAEQDRTSLPAQLRRQVNAAILRLKNDPTWSPPQRLPAPADSRHSGCIVDLTLASRAIVIVYRIHDRGAEVEIVRIERIAIG